MEIHQNKFCSTLSVIEDISGQINKVFWQLQKHIKHRNLKVYVAYRDLFDLKLKADWDNFNLILFSLIHNSVKYNYSSGEIFLIISRKKHKIDK